MHHRLSCRLLAAALLAIALATPAVAGQRVAVLEGPALAVFDVDSGTVLSRVVLPINGSQMLITADRTRVLVLSRGAGNETRDHQFIPTGKSAVAVVDLGSGKVTGSSELGWGIGDSAFAADGTLYLLTPGYQSSKANEQRPAELMAIDSTSGSIVKRAALTRGADAFAVVGEPKVLVVFIRSAQNLPAELHFIDPETFRERGKTVLRGDPAPPVAIPGSSFLYSIDSSKDGAVEVISTADGAVAATLDTGEAPKLGAIDPEMKRLFVLAARTAAGSAPSGIVSVVREKTVETSIPLAVFEPTEAQLSADRKWLTLAGLKFKRHFGFREVAVSRIDLSTNTPGPIVETPGIYPREFVTTADNGTMIMFHGGEKSCCAVMIEDLVSGKHLATIGVGSRGKRIGAALLALGMSAASFSAARSSAIAHGQSSFVYSIYTPRMHYSETRGPLALRADERFVYVIDPATDFLTVVDLEKKATVANFGIGSGVRELMMLDGKTLSAISESSVVLVDTSTHQKGAEIKDIGAITDVAVSADRSTMFVLGRVRAVMVRNGGQPQAMGDIAHPVQLIFLH